MPTSGDGACNASMIRLFKSATLNGFANRGMPDTPLVCRISACPEISSARSPWWSRLGAVDDR